jgi:hypothetical protein
VPFADSRVFTLLLAAWCAAWIALGVWTGYEVNALRALSDTVVQAGVAVQSTGEALQRVGSIPFVPADIGSIGRQVSTAGASAVTNGRASRSTVDTLAILLGLAVGLIPVGPVVLLYFLLRRTRRG